MNKWENIKFEGCTNNPAFPKERYTISAYVKFLNKKKDDFGNEYNVYDVVMCDDSDGKYSIVRSEIDFWAFGSYGTIHQKIEETKEEFRQFYSVECENEKQLAVYGVHGWSVWSNDFFKDDFTKDEYVSYLREVGNFS